MIRGTSFLSLLCLSCLVALQVENASAEKLRVLIIDGQNNHDWQTTTPLLKSMLQKSGRFVAEVATAPAEGEAMDNFKPDFSAYDAVMSNYNGERWSAEPEKAFAEYVHNGGGYVSVHAANNAFPEWPEYNRIIGLGGWYGRGDHSGPYLYVANDGRRVRDDSPGRCGHHGPQHEFRVETRRPDHPIMAGLPKIWLHTRDELYDSLRGPAEQVEILATAYSSPEEKGTDRREPMLMTVRYGEGRVFHTVLGHADYSMNCVGFITTLLRGTEWAATGEVTIEVPDDFPTVDSTSSR